MAQHLLLFLLLVTTLFLALRLIPGDAATLVLGERASVEAKMALNHRLHWDEPLYVQYAYFLRGLFTLNGGESLRRPGVSAALRVGQSLGSTATLALTAVLLAALFGTGSALLSQGPWLGRHRYTMERARVGVAAVPLLALAPVATYFLAAKWRIVPLPGDPDAGVLGLAFAALLLAIPLSAQVGRMAHAALGAQMRQPFLLVVQAKGANPVRVYCMHALLAASGPILMVLGTQLGALLGGAVVLEKLFDRPGLGTLIVESYACRDLPVLEWALAAAGGLFIFTQAAFSFLHAFLDPRARS